MEQMAEAPGAPPAWVLDPRLPVTEDHDSPVITARFYLGPDPRPDAVGNLHIGEDGTVPIVEMVEIINRNDPKNSPMVQISTDYHRFRSRKQGGYPEEYRAFKAGLETLSTGTPIKEWLGDNSRTKNLEHFDIYTVEQLAAISDGLCQTLGAGTFDLRKRARAYLTVLKDTGAAEQALAENDVLRQQMEAMQKQLAILTAGMQQKNIQAPEQFPELTASEQLPAEPTRRGPGRPRVNQES